MENQTIPKTTKNQSEDIFVGQVLYLEETKRHQDSEIIEVTVGSIGKKYLYLEGWREQYPVDKKTLEYRHKNYSQHNFQLYRSRQEILDKWERSKLYNLLQKHFNWSGSGSKNTLEQLRKAVQALGINNDN